jgi:zinc/manganese transport system permease protein
MTLFSCLYDVFILPFADFAFMRRALAGAFALSLGGAPVGVFLMLRRMSLMGDVMAHAILPGAAIGYLMMGLSLPAMMLGGLGAGLLVALLAGIVARNGLLQEDAALAAFYLMSLALGVTLISLRGSNIDLLHVLFGSVLALDDAALITLGGIATLSVTMLAFVYRGLVLECADPSFMRSVGRAGGVVHLLFLTLVVLNLVAGFQALGTLLAVGLMLLPAAAARFWARGLTSLLACAVLLGLLSSLAGLLVSFHAGTPAGPAIILVTGGVYVVSLFCGTAGGVLWGLVPRKHFEA